jgi:8-oxo-dGTP pyrophosphatase MutT (NUDIX family)
VDAALTRGYLADFDVDVAFMQHRPVQPIRPAATVILVREAEPGYEILMLRRTSDAAFAGGMYVFPGGRVDGDDHLHLYDAFRRGPTAAQAAQQRALGDEWRGYWIACIRESFEEAGVLLAYDAAGRLVDPAEPQHRARLEAHRHALNAGERSLADICAAESLTLAVDRIHYFNRWITPEGRPRRFDTRFFVAVAPPGQHGRHDAKETDDSLWVRPHDALARNDAGDFGLMGVTRKQLEALAQFRTVLELEREILGRIEYPVYRPHLPAGS